MGLNVRGHPQRCLLFAEPLAGTIDVPAGNSCLLGLRGRHAQFEAGHAPGSISLRVPMQGIGIFEQVQRGSYKYPRRGHQWMAPAW